MNSLIYVSRIARGRRGRDRMVVEYTTTCAIVHIPAKVVSSNPVHGEVYSIQHYVIQFVSDCTKFSIVNPSCFILFFSNT